MHKRCTINFAHVSHNAMQSRWTQLQSMVLRLCMIYLHLWKSERLWNQCPVFFLSSEKNNNNNKTAKKVLKTKTIRINGNGMLGRNVSLSCSSSIVKRRWGEKQTHFPSTAMRRGAVRQILYDITRGKYVQSDVTRGDYCDLCVCKQHHHLHPEQHVSVIRTKHWFRINTSKSIWLRFSTSRAFLDDFICSVSKLLLRSANILIVFSHGSLNCSHTSKTFRLSGPVLTSCISLTHLPCWIMAVWKEADTNGVHPAETQKGSRHHTER